MIRAENITYKIGARNVLDGVSLNVRPGTLTAIVGPNGSGKTTLMKAICGEIQSSGTIHINDQNLRHLKPWQAANMRAVLPQVSTISFPFTVHEIVRLGTVTGRAGADRLQSNDLPAKALHRVGLGSYGGRQYGELSGGEQQRVQLARVLCQVWEPVLDGQPRYLLLDEPVSSLDIKHQLQIMEIARNFARDGGGVVAILHDLNLASLFADQIALMSDGRFAANGTPREVLQDDLLREVFGCGLRVDVMPTDDRPFVLPQSVQF